MPGGLDQGEDGLGRALMLDECWRAGAVVANLHQRVEVHGDEVAQRRKRAWPLRVFRSVGQFSRSVGFELFVAVPGGLFGHQPNLGTISKRYLSSVTLSRTIFYFARMFFISRRGSAVVFFA